MFLQWSSCSSLVLARIERSLKRYSCYISPQWFSWLPPWYTLLCCENSRVVRWSLVLVLHQQGAHNSNVLTIFDPLRSVIVRVFIDNEIQTTSTLYITPKRIRNVNVALTGDRDRGNVFSDIVRNVQSVKPAASYTMCTDLQIWISEFVPLIIQSVSRAWFLIHDAVFQREKSDRNANFERLFSSLRFWQRSVEDNFCTVSMFL